MWLATTIAVSMVTGVSNVQVLPVYEQPQVVEVIPLILLKIAECESGNRQFDETGQVLRGQINPHDVGRFQINEDYHLVKAKELGFDIYTTQGNTDYALWLYKQNGTKDWSWSRNCWRHWSASLIPLEL